MFPCRLLKSSFMDDIFQHLALNVFALFQIAPEVESVLGYQTFLAVYLLAGLGGSTATFVFGDTITVGASSCIFGLIGEDTMWPSAGNLGDELLCLPSNTQPFAIHCAMYRH